MVTSSSAIMERWLRNSRKGSASVSKSAAAMMTTTVNRPVVRPGAVQPESCWSSPRF